MTALVSSDIFSNYGVWFALVPFFVAAFINYISDESDAMSYLYRIGCHLIALLVSSYLASEAMALNVWNVNVQCDVSGLGVYLWVWAVINLVFGIIALVQLLRLSYEESEG